MISICIPIYNDDVTALVNELHSQCADSLVEYEILLLDDASVDRGIKEKNQKLADLTNVYYHNNSESIGLAGTRNRLGELARYPYLLFIDSDMQVVIQDYIMRYLKLCQPSVVSFGGCVYPDKCTDSRYILRWKYGKKKEEGVGKYYSCFNFLIDREIFHKHPFCQSDHQCEYEDALFGIILKKNKIDILFVDNPLLYEKKITSDDFIGRIDQSLSDLLIVEKFLKNESIEPEIRLLNKVQQLDRFGIQSLIVFFWDKFKNVCLNNLKSEKPSLFVLDFYKLGYFCYLKKQKKNADS